MEYLEWLVLFGLGCLWWSDGRAQRRREAEIRRAREVLDLELDFL